jgi:hypothetical protein
MSHILNKANSIKFTCEAVGKQYVENKCVETKETGDNK